MHTIKYVNVKLPKIMLEYMYCSSIILNICCLLLELHPIINVRLILYEENKIHLPNRFIHNTQSKDDC